jgi:hypothetical protein
MNQERNPKLEIDLHMRDLRVAIRSGKLATTMEIVEKVAKLLDKLKDQEVFEGFECFQIAKRAWLASGEFDNRQDFFLARHPVMEKYRFYKDSSTDVDFHHFDEFDWWDQVAKELILENEIDHPALVNLASEKRIQDSVQIRTHVLLNVIGPIIHYTPIENLPSIVENGIVSVSESKNKNIKVVNNDSQRLDNLLDWISTSITHPNYPYLHSLRMREPQKQFAILELDPKLLWTHDWIAFPTNAAAKESQSLLLHDSNRLVGLNGLINLFRNGMSRDRTNPAQISRSTYNLGDNETTDPQAEVMFHREIPIGCIKKIHFEFSKDHTGLNDSQIRTMVARLPNVYEFQSRKYFMRPVDYSWMDRKINPMALEN